MFIIKKLIHTIKQRLFSPQEAETKLYISEEDSQIYYLLCQALEGRFVIVPKVALHDIVDPQKAGPNCIFDFGVFTPTFQIVAVVISDVKNETHWLSDVGITVVNINQPDQVDWHMHIDSLRCTLVGNNNNDTGLVSLH
ncbi:hypothetical protein [Pseudoalteromonas luteoviolacea]|uniref:hypothetical protein n=1 Tax=Pseudoalteromonas luteoviolacea TaxID=43657 RepID=UPI001B384601|nr:hypothetical protein [Pseudoalteromonas luteoviolacea]MBQ4839857.1 hypothetical protein [Pseudoalteromonas luteoviolacea]